MSTLGDHMLESLDARDLAELARRLAPLLPLPPPPIDREDDAWIGTNQAARYLSLSRSQLHKLAAAGEIPCHQDGAGCRYYFRASELDAWRRGEWTCSTR